MPAQSFNRKQVAQIKFKELVITNIVLTLVLLGFITSLIGIRPYIKVVTDEIKFTHVAKEYNQLWNEKQNFKKPLIKKKILMTKTSV